MGCSPGKFVVSALLDHADHHPGCKEVENLITYFATKLSDFMTEEEFDVWLNTIITRAKNGFTP